MPILLFFLLLPFLEFMAFGMVSARMGWWNALGLLFFDSIVGMAVLQNQGFKALRRPRSETPFDQLCIMTAGILLIIPGFITDVIGVLLLLSPMRALLKTALKAQGRWKIYESTTTMRSSDTIEGEFERLEDTPPETRDKMD